MIPAQTLYPRTGDKNTIYLNQAITNPAITVGDYTMYHEFEYDPVLFEKKNVLYQYPINHDRLKIGKFCSIASGVRFLLRPTTRWARFQPIRFRCFTKPGDWTCRTLPGHGTTKAILKSAMMYGSAIRR